MYLENGQSYVLTQCKFYLHFHLPPHAPFLSRKAISVWANSLKTMDQITRQGGSARNVRIT